MDPAAIPNSHRSAPIVQSGMGKSPTVRLPPTSNPRDRSTPNGLPDKVPSPRQPVETKPAHTHQSQSNVHTRPDRQPQEWKDSHTARISRMSDEHLAPRSTCRKDPAEASESIQHQWCHDRSV